MDVPAAANDPAAPAEIDQRVECGGRSLHDGKTHQFCGLDERDQTGHYEDGIHHV